MTEKLFAVSVADALLIDDKSDKLVVKGKALLTSTMDQAVQESEVFAGRGSQLQFTYNYQKVLTFTIEAADFSPTYMAIQTGSTIKNELSKFFAEEKVKFDGTGLGTLAKAPLGNVYVDMAAEYSTFTPTGSTITIPAMANKEAFVSYQYEATLDKLTIPADSFAKSYKLVLTSDIFSADGDKAYEQQIIVNRYKLDGNFSLALTHDAVTSFTLSGKSLVDEDGNYATITWAPTDGVAPIISTIATIPSEVELASGATQQVQVLGIRGGVYGNVTLDPANLTFTSEDPLVADFIGGVITAVGTGKTNVKVSDGTYTDVVEVTVL